MSFPILGKYTSKLDSCSHIFQTFACVSNKLSLIIILSREGPLGIPVEVYCSSQMLTFDMPSWLRELVRQWYICDEFCAFLLWPEMYVPA